MFPPSYMWIVEKNFLVTFQRQHLNRPWVPDLRRIPVP